MCRQLLQALCPMLHVLCELAISRLEALHTGVQVNLSSPQPPASPQHAKRSNMHSNTEGQPCAHQALSTPYPHTSVNVTQLGILLSAILLASEGLQPQDDKECWDAIQEVREIMMETTVPHAQLFNGALKIACRYVCTEFLRGCACTI